MSARTGSKGSGLKFSPWNLLLILPLWMLITPLVNREEPVLFGMPFFYWIQLAAVLVGISATFVVYRMTRNDPGKQGTPEKAEDKAVRDE